MLPKMLPESQSIILPVEGVKIRLQKKPGTGNEHQSQYKIFDITGRYLDEVTSTVRDFETQPWDRLQRYLGLIPR